MLIAAGLMALMIESIQLPCRHVSLPLLAYFSSLIWRHRQPHTAYRHPLLDAAAADADVFLLPLLAAGHFRRFTLYATSITLMLPPISLITRCRRQAPLS